MNRKAQTESGPLQTIFIGVILVALVAFAATLVISDLNNNYGNPLSEDNFTTFQDDFEELANVSEELSNKINDIDSAGDIIVVAVTGGYKSLIQFLTTIPSIANNIISEGLEALGLGAYAWFAYLIIITIMLFAIIALIMKVRG